MVIYLLRHGIAVERGSGSYPNDDRPLTEDGRAKMKKAAEGIVRCVPLPDLILTSPLMRARDTASIVAKAYREEDIMQETKLLLPGAPPAPLWDELRGRRSLKSVMLVGHEPDLSGIACALLASPTLLVEFKKGSLCAIETPSLPPRQAGTLMWMLAPRQLRLIASR